MDLILLGHQDIRDVIVRDDGEPIVDLAAHFPELAFDESRRFVQSVSPSISHGRRQIGEMLTRAQRALPPGYRFLIKECYRPLSIQQEYWDDHRGFLRRKHPQWSAAEIDMECSKYVAPVSVAPHSTGGAVDLILIDGNGDWVDMGCNMNAEPSSCEYRTYFNSDRITPAARGHREILRAALEGVGFVNYPTEWWHWSYGDKYWAYVTKAPAALYASVDQG